MNKTTYTVEIEVDVETDQITEVSVRARNYGQGFDHHMKEATGDLGKVLEAMPASDREGGLNRMARLWWETALPTDQVDYPSYRRARAADL